MVGELLADYIICRLRMTVKEARTDEGLTTVFMKIFNRMSVHGNNNPLAVTDGNWKGKIFDPVKRWFVHR